MNKLWKLSVLCTCCLCLTAADSALAKFTRLVNISKADDDTVDFCNNANGPNIDEPLDVLNLLAGFDDPLDRLLNVGNADISTSAPTFFQHTSAFFVTAPNCGQLAADAGPAGAVGRLPGSGAVYTPR